MDAKDRFEELDRILAGMTSEQKHLLLFAVRQLGGSFSFDWERFKTQSNFSSARLDVPRLGGPMATIASTWISDEPPVLPAADGLTMEATEETELVLVSSALVVEVSNDETQRGEALERVGEKLLLALRELSRQEPAARATGCLRFDGLGDPDVNARRCEDCGRWATEFNKPDEINTLPWGMVGDGIFRCLQCDDRDREDGMTSAEL